MYQIITNTTLMVIVSIILLLLAIAIIAINNVKNKAYINEYIYIQGMYDELETIKEKDPALYAYRKKYVRQRLYEIIDDIPYPQYFYAKTILRKLNKE